MLPTAMDETERRVELKKAYAEMILNTTKEAAARVMVAERKSQKFGQDLLSTKGEALRMLLRMKQMIDAKNSEVEITSLNQKRRINELEAQLDEAEGLIIDLRAKLSQVQDQLDDVKSKHMHSLGQTEELDMPSQNKIYENEQSFFSPLKSFSELEPKAVDSEVLTSTSEHSILVHQCLTSAKETARPNTEFDHCPVLKPVFASVITKQKDPELFRNGCTERIRAIEMGLVDKKLHSAHEIVSPLENKSRIRKKGQNEVIDSISFSRTDKLGELDKYAEQAAFLKDNTANDQPVKLHKVRRRKVRYGKTKTASCKNRSGQIVKPRRTSFAISRCKSHSHTSSDVHKRGCVSTSTRNINEVDYICGLEEKESLGKQQTVSVIRRSVRKRKIKHWDGFATSCWPNDSHSCRYDEPCHTDKTGKCDEKASKNLLEVEDGGELEEGICVRAASANVTTCTNSGEGSTILGDVAEKDTKLIGKSMSEKQDGLPPQLELENILLVPSNLRDIRTSEMTTKAPSQPAGNMPLKYTFSRKRKKGALTNPAENNSFQQSLRKKRCGEETDDVLAPENSHSANESSRDGRRLVQVARQLISLSARRWW